MRGVSGIRATGDDAVQPTSPLEGIQAVPRSTADARRWYDQLSPWYDLLVDPFESTGRETGVTQLSPQRGDLVLDIGCGTGSALVDLAEAVGPAGSAIGIDLSAAMCRRTQQRIADQALRQTAVVHGDARSLPFADDSFDAAFASFVLELFDTSDLVPVAQEWRRILKSDGSLVVVALSRRSTGPAVRAYEWFHHRFPTRLDCRPIHVTNTLRMSGFNLDDRIEQSIAGLPIDIVRVRP